MKLTYAEQLKHPNWQKRRLEMLDFFGWRCVDCDASEKTLHVHHKQYFKGRMAWEYSNEELTVLCEDCHKDEHRMQERIKQILSQVLTHEALAVLAGYFCREISDPGMVEEARQTNPLMFAHGFVGSLLTMSLPSTEEAAVFVTRNNDRTKQIFEQAREQVFRLEG